jgi:chromosome segregation ATPase
MLVWITAISIIFLMGLVIFIYQLPTDKMPKKKRPPPPPPPNKEKDWEGISRRWEKNNAVLVNEIEALKKDRKLLLEKLDDDKKIIREQNEQLAREKAWREKEILVVEKVKNVDHELKDELKKAQKALDEEHSVKLRLDRDLQEHKINLSNFKDENRALSIKLMSTEKELEIAGKELRELKRTNTELKKQKEDIQWVAKTDYDEVKMKLKQAESELARLTRDQKDNG